MPPVPWKDRIFVLCLRKQQSIRRALYLLLSVYVILLLVSSSRPTTTRTNPQQQQPNLRQASSSSASSSSSSSRSTTSITTTTNNREALQPLLQKAPTRGFTKEILRAGNGVKPKRGQSVTVHCTGFGKNHDLKEKFWSTHDPGQKPFTFNVGMGNGECISSRPQ